MSIRDLKARAIVDAVADAAERWTNADFPPRVRATSRIVERTGYSIPVVEFALDALFGSITAGALIATIEDEIGSPEALDGFAPRRGRPDAWASPIGQVCILSSRTTIGVALPAALFALCAKCDVLVKDRKDALIAEFFETLVQEDASFQNAAHAQRWESGDEHAPDLRHFDAVVAFGTQETLEAIRSSTGPEARFIPFGPRLSAGYVARESLNARQAREIADAAARDIVLYETEGCLSLHLLFIEESKEISVSEFRGILDDAIARASVEFPPSEPDRSRVGVIAQQRAMTMFRGAPCHGEPVEPRPSNLEARATKIVAVGGAQEALKYIKGHRVPLEAFAISQRRPDLERLAVDAGAVHIARFGTLQTPSLEDHHGGRGRLSDFIRWIDRSF